MSDRRFTLDTNILVYALDQRADYRHGISSHIIDRGVRLDCWLTLQSVSEFYSAVTRKRLVSRTEAIAQALDWLDMFQMASASSNAVRTALASVAAGRASYWDALLVATAAEAGCSAILTEDLADGTTMFGVRIVNPFAGAALSPAAEALLIAE
jgi:predicted nucleic acid-binding protein